MRAAVAIVSALASIPTTVVVHGSSSSSSTSSSLWSSLTDFVYETSNVVYDRIEEGTNILRNWETISSKATSNINDDNNKNINKKGNHNKGDTSLDDEQLDDQHSSPLDGIADSVLDDILSKQKGPQTLQEHIHAFTSAINWSEPFIIGILAFHIVIIITSIIAMQRKSITLRLIIFALALIITRSAEYLNTTLRNNWQNYNITTQNYFDVHGYFMLIMICVPLLLVCIILLFHFIWEAKTLLIQTKRMEINSKNSNKKKMSERIGEKTQQEQQQEQQVDKGKRTRTLEEKAKVGKQE